MEVVVSGILLILGGYLLVGFFFSILFMWKGLEKVDADTKGTSLFLKIILFPGMTALWIVFLRKWLKAKAQ